MKKIFEVHQKITVLVNEYLILKDSSDGKQKLAGYAKQKRLALREKFTLFADERQTKVLATSQARSAIDLAPTFDVFDDKGQSLAVIKKDFKKSLLVSSWNVYDASGKNALFTIREKSTAVAVSRRAWEFIPVISEFIPFPLKFHFTIRAGSNSVGEYLKTTTLRDHYAFSLDEKHLSDLDERVWMVTAILLDAMQSR